MFQNLQRGRRVRVRAGTNTAHRLRHVRLDQHFHASNFSEVHHLPSRQLFPPPVRRHPLRLHFTETQQISELLQPLEPTGTRSTDPKAPKIQEICGLYRTFRRDFFKFDQHHVVGLYHDEPYIICCPGQSSGTGQHLHPPTTFGVPVADHNLHDLIDLSKRNHSGPRLLSNWIDC